jgi:hypothetical protein
MVATVAPELVVDSVQGKEEVPPTARSFRAKRPIASAAASSPEPVPVGDEAPAVVPERVVSPTREPVVFNKRKLRGIRIKMMDEGSEEK